MPQAQLNFVHKTGYDSVISGELVKPRVGFEVTNELLVYAKEETDSFTFTNESDKFTAKLHWLCIFTEGDSDEGFVFPWKLLFAD